MLHNNLKLVIGRVCLTTGNTAGSKYCEATGSNPNTHICDNREKQNEIDT